MKRRHWVPGAVSLALLLIPESSVLGEPAQGHVELATLIDSLLADEGEAAGLFDWSWGSGANDPIAWQHKGIEEAPRAAQPHGPYQRRGNVVVTVGGQVTHHVLAEKQSPGSWNVTLRGPRGGWTRVVIESDVNSPELCDLRLASLGEGLSFEPYKCKDEPAASGTPVYTVHKAGKKLAWLRNEYSGGSAGCSQRYELVFDRAEADPVQCWGDEAESPESLIRRALEAEEVGQLDDAIALHKSVVAAQPGNVRSLNSIAGLYGTQGRYGDEIAWANRALAIDPAYSPAWVNLGNAHLALGDLPQAEAAYGRGVAANPRYPVAHYHLGVAHEQMGDLAAAEKNYRNAIAVDEKFEVAYFNLGALTARQGRFDEASGWLKRLLAIEPSHADARTMLQHVEAERAKPGRPRAQAQPTSLAGRMPFAPGQGWAGTYLCGQGLTAFALRITDVENQRVTATFDFTVSPDVSGRFQIHGDYQPALQRIAFRPGEWISRPSGYVAVGLLGHVDSDGSVMAGVLDARGCGSFTLAKDEG